MWRPEGWKCPYLGRKAQRYFELGADAMYQPAYRKGRKDAREALRKGASININTKALGKGKWVFLPDEEE